MIKFGAAAAVLLAALVAISAAAGTSSVRTKYKHFPSGSYVDDTLCSFPVTVNGFDNFSVTDYFDDTGALVKTVVKDKFTGTVTGPNGVVLNKSENATITDDWITGTVDWQGLAERYSYQKGPVITQDTGDITFDQDGNVIYEVGPHPIADGPGADAVCAVLSV